MDWFKTPKIGMTIVLLLVSALYFIAVFSFFAWMANDTIAAVLTFGSYLTIMAIIWGYGFKVRLPGSEITFYPIENVMRQPYTIQEGKTGRDAEDLMEKTGMDFINIVDKLGQFKGIFTQADAHKARIGRKLGERIENLMTLRDKVVKASENETLVDILDRIGKTKHSRLPVIDDKNRVIGVVDSVDINNLIAKILKRSI